MHKQGKKGTFRTRAIELFCCFFFFCYCYSWSVVTNMTSIPARLSNSIPSSRR